MGWLTVGLIIQPVFAHSLKMLKERLKTEISHFEGIQFDDGRETILAFVSRNLNKYNNFDAKIYRSANINREDDLQIIDLMETMANNRETVLLHMINPGFDLTEAFELYKNLSKSHIKKTQFIRSIRQNNSQKITKRIKLKTYSGKSLYQLVDNYDNTVRL